MSALALLAAMVFAMPALAADGPRLGQPISPSDLAPWDISVGADGVGLPPGRGTAAQGEAVYVSKCQACHGEKGAGRPNDALVGGQGTLASDRPPVKTVGSYWPYATTLFDYVRRAMPWNETKSMSNDELYAVSAYILHLNGVIARRRRARCPVAAQGEDAESRRVHSVPAGKSVARMSLKRVYARLPTRYGDMRRCRHTASPRMSP